MTTKMLSLLPIWHFYEPFFDQKNRRVNKGVSERQKNVHMQEHSLIESLEETETETDEVCFDKYLFDYN